MALIVCGLEAELCAVEVIVGEEESTEVVEVCDALACGVERQRW
jgi:hypothetical protein